MFKVIKATDHPQAIMACERDGVDPAKMWGLLACDVQARKTMGGEYAYFTSPEQAREYGRTFCGREVELDLTKTRRALEDRIRKDEELVKRLALEILGGIYPVL